MSGPYGIDDFDGEDDAGEVGHGRVVRDADVDRCPECGGSLTKRRVDGEGRILEGCVCDGPYSEPGWVTL